jgi:hypothetical protein
MSWAEAVAGGGRGKTGDGSAGAGRLISKSRGLHARCPQATFITLAAINLMTYNLRIHSNMESGV